MNKRQKIVQEAFIDNEEAVIKQLKQVYNDSLDSINEKTKALQAEILNIQAQLDKVEDEDKRAVLKSMEQSKIYQKQYQDALKKQVSSILDNMQVEEFKTVSDYLNKCYEEGFVGTLYDLQGQGIPMAFPLDQEAMVRAVQTDSKISQGLYTRLGEDVSLLKKKITAQVSRGIATGMSYAQVAQQLAGYTKIGFNNAVRIARTEGHRIQVQSTMDACHKAKDRGADVVKQWDAALDARTRDSHARVDGEIKELDEKFSNGLMFPGDPSGSAAEVVNCRCALLQRGRWAVEGGFTKMNNFTKQLETFESPEDYAEFKKGFFSKENKQYMNYVQQMEDKYKTKDFATILSKMDDREYKHYSKLLEGNPMFNKNVAKAEEVVGVVKKKALFTAAKTQKEAEDFIRQYVDDKQFGALGVSYSGISVDVANKVNETLNDLFETYNFEQLGGVFVAKGNTKIGKMVDGAVAAYSPIRKSLILNNRALKNVDDIVKSHAEEVRLIKLYASDPSSIHFKTKRAELVTKASLKSGRATVPDTIEDVINHEMGHALEKSVAQSDKFETIKRNMTKYAENISGYATTDVSEYIAESFASYRKGEKVIDPDLLDVFQSFAKNKTKIDVNGITKGMESLDKIGKNGIIVSDKQFGKKIGKHAVDYDLNPQKAEDRDKMRDIIADIIDNNDDYAEGEWRGQTGTVQFFIKENDVVVVNEKNEFVTILKGGVSSERVKKARKQKV